MPYKIEYRKGQTRPFKIIAILTGEIVGSSETRVKAEASVRARLAGAHGWEPKRR